MKRILCLVLSLLLVFAMTACGGNNGSNDEASGELDFSKLEAAILMPAVEGQIYVSLTYGCVAQAEELGMPTPVVLSAGGYGQLDTQISQVEDMIAAGKDIIIIMPLSKDGMAPVLDEAVEAGITVMEMGNVSNAELVKGRMLTDQITIGEMLGEACIESLNGQGNIVMFNGPAGASWSELETKGFLSAMEKAPGINILAQKYTEYDAGVAMNTMNDLLQTFSDIDYIYTAYDLYADGVLSALEQAGRTDIKVSTVNLTTNNIGALKEGKLDYIVTTESVQEGRDTMLSAIALLKGEEIPPIQYCSLVGYRSEDITDSLDTSRMFYPQGWKVPL